VKRPRKPKPHYTMIAVTLASTKRVLRLTPKAKRLLAYFHSLWRPGKRIVAPVRTVAETLGLKTDTVKRAINELLGVGLIERVREHVPPGYRGRGRAAEYRLIHRPKDSFRPNSPQLRIGVFAVIEHGDEKRIGYIRILTSEFIGLLRDLSDTELELLWVLAFRNNTRDKYGAISADPQMSLTEAHTLLPNIPVRSLSHAANSLIDRKLLTVVSPPAGRRSMTVSPTGVSANGLPWGGRRKTLGMDGSYKGTPWLPTKWSKHPVAKPNGPNIERF
jgi:hypothetical protein